MIKNVKKIVKVECLLKSNFSRILLTKMIRLGEF